MLVGRPAESIAARIGAWSRRQAARLLVARALELHVEGLEHVPASGPVILVARHYHHLYDAAAILASVLREVHVLIALDWLGSGPRLRVMRRLAAAARWPGVWRPGPGWRLNREGYHQSLHVLRDGGLLLVFPEGYPTIDPAGVHQKDADGFGLFDPGFLVLAKRAGVPVPIVPVGLWYSPRPGRGWTVWLRFGEPIFNQQMASIESSVRSLSRAPCPISANDSRGRDPEASPTSPRASPR